MIDIWLKLILITWCFVASGKPDVKNTSPICLFVGFRPLEMANSINCRPGWLVSNSIFNPVDGDIKLNLSLSCCLLSVRPQLMTQKPGNSVSVKFGFVLDSMAQVNLIEIYTLYFSSLDSFVVGWEIWQVETRVWGEDNFTLNTAQLVELNCWVIKMSLGITSRRSIRLIE